jgi:MFS family permease
MLAANSMALIIGWQAYNLAREELGIGPSAGILGLLGLIQFVPLFILTPLVGWVADRIDRRWIARTVLAGQLMLAAVLAFLTWTGTITLVAIYVVAVVLGVFRAFMGPALSALAPNLVPKESLPRAIALSTVAWQVGVIAGPGLSGPLYAIFPSLPYWVASALFGIALFLMFRIGPVPRPPVELNRHPIRQIMDGMSYVWTNKLVLGAISLDLFIMFLAGAQAMIPVFARDILDAGEIGLSLLAASQATGAIITSLIFSFAPLSRNVGMKMLVAMAAFGAATIGFGLSTWLPLSMVFLALCGAADMFSVYIRNSLIQLHTPDKMRGRVGSVSQMTISASNELGDAMTGGLAVLIGPIGAVVAGGGGAILVAVLWSRIFPEIRAARTFDPPKHIEEGRDVFPSSSS